MVKLNFMKAILMALVLVLPSAVNATGGGKLVYQDTDPSSANYLNNRRALVGPGCTVNSVGDGVKVLSGVKNLQNICNDDLDDYAEFIGLADATVVGAPVFSVKDNQHYYAGGMEAGFTICANSKSGLLSLDLASFFKIQFLKDGEKVGGLCDIENAKNVTGLGLSLITIPGSDLVTKSFIAKAPGDFDEIKLVSLGVKADALATFNVKYAFVGSAREYTITNNKENGISKYATDFGRGEIKLEAHGISPTAHDGSSLLDRVIDDNLDNGFTVSAVLKVGSSLPVTVVARTTDGKETFPAGTEVGFKYNSSTVLDLGVGNGASITLYDKDNKEIDTYTISGTVLGLGVIKVSKDGEMILKAPKDFSSVKLQFPGVLDLNLGRDKVNYAFVRMAPSLASHHCKINAPLTRNVAAYEKEFTLQSNPNIPVAWKLEEQPEGSNITLDATTGKVSNISVPGDYKFTVEVTSKDNCKFLAEGKEACKETTIVHYANAEKKAAEGMTLLVNNEGEPVKYQLSDKFGGGLLSIIAKDVKNASAVLTSALSDFTYRIPNIKLAQNSGIVGIKSVDGSNLAKSVNGKNMRAGFVVSTKTSGLKADVLNLYNIKLFKNGEEVMHSATTNWDAISAGLIGSEQSHKMRLSIDVPQGADFDEIVLYNTGVLEANLSQLNIYYAYVCDADKDNATSNVMQDAQVVSTENTNASIDLEHTTMFNVANVGNGNNNMSNLIDGDDETAFTLPLGVDLGGSTVAVNIGKTVNPGQQLVMLTNNLSLGLGVSLGKVLKVTTWLNGENQEELTNWQVLNADVIGTGVAPKAAAGTGGKGYVALTATKPFDNVRITSVKGLSLLQNTQIYGLGVRDLINEDGSIDTGKDLLLDEDKTLDEKDTYMGAKMIFHRTFNKDKWNSLILPVDMTAAQVESAFGKGTEVSRFNRLEDNWIYFTPVTEDNGVLIHKNIPYIIKPTKEPLANTEYTVGSSIKTIEGPVYIATGISYTDETANLKHQDEVNNGMIHYGSYVRQNKTNDANDFVPMGAYMLNNGDMVHTAKNHYVKGYRCWLVETNPSEKTLQMAFTTGDNNTTGIKTVEEQNRNDKMGIYSISGVRMNSNNADNLPKGMYIVNNKKVFVK